MEGVTEQSISIYWEEPWGEIDIEKYHVYLNGKLIEEITDPYSTTYTYNDLLQETTYQLKVDIFYMDGTIETIEAEATTTPVPVGEKVQFKDENLKTAIADALKIYHRDVYVDDMERLTSLEASYLEIKDLTGLEYATNLVDLSLSGNEIKGIAPIKNLKNLSYLDLEANQITSIINLSNLENLDSIFLANNELEDIKALLELPNLTHASVYGNPGLDFTKGSEDMAVVKELFENGVYVEWSDLEHELLVTDVTESTVDFEFNFIEVVDNIKKYIIYVNGEEVTETHVSKPFYKLTGLDPLSDIDIMVEGVDEDGFVWGSVYTYVTTTPIPSGEPVQFVDSALEEAVRETLHIKSRAIVESDMSILPSLDAMNRGITDLTGLEYATNLEELHLDSNAITNIEPLKGLTNLAYLSLYENKVKDISALENLNIEFLNLGSNEITDISSLLTLENLGFVLIMKNPLDFNEGSETLKVIKELEQKEIFVLYEYLDITAHHVSDSEVELSWEAFTTDGFEDFSYMVFVDGEIVAEDIKDTTFLLTDLEAETEYSIEVVGFDENAERLIFGTIVLTTAAAGEEPVDEPGDETDPEEGETPVEQPVDDKDEVTTPGKNTGKGNTPKETNDKNQDKKNDNKKNDDKKLPTTATNSYNILLFGLLLLGAGIIAIMANRRVTGTGPSSHQ
ncbi:leucine-rich repeat domain-containing protein [Fredinandcohnia onubensis]|uniref:leucine-rich repeat domain-containing protein n=1 Tax=Fredinandcohnia onubensis TaxID=1571209 RepID=UPI000C0BC01C|nr:leucine-rich repeat domain-containing protein [Fredinandcohnia onubensis]